MVLEAVGPHVDVVEPARSGPQVLGADGERGDAVGAEGFTSSQQLVVGVWNADAVGFHDVTARVHAPLVERVGCAVLLAVKSNGRSGGRHCVEQAAVGPNVGNVHEQAIFNEAGHPVTSEPHADVRALVSNQEVTDRGLVCFVLGGVDGDVDVGVSGFEHLHDFGQSGHRRRVRSVRGDNELAFSMRGRAKCQRSNASQNQLFHDFLPKKARP